MNDNSPAAESGPSKAAAKLKTGLETGMLAFARSLQISEGLFAAHCGEGTPRVPVLVEEKGVRGQSSEDNAKKPGLSNPQVVDAAHMPVGCTHLDLSFTLRVMPTSGRPHASDAPVVAANYREISGMYADLGGYRLLSELYVWNILNGRFVWRNRFQTDRARVTVAFEGTTLEVDPFALDLDEPAGKGAMASAITKGSAEDLAQLVAGFERGLTERAFQADVVFTSDLKPGMEIWPSQEYVREEAKDSKSRHYASLPVFVSGRAARQASMHSQKIGAAIRHIDIWHGSDSYGAIAVNPYGGVQETGEVLRSKKSSPSFYDMRSKHADLVKALGKATSAKDLDGNIHFFFANLVRGGVFGGKSKDAKG
ncbi:type I-F CRISPR-associated protein Csy3 [Defluviimonas salinarum]|uniref:Type I-F CRISPR-associated protein Csy3 n=1 Tax=Defluviimonas salinarum TaxID=2992147 RepID=A0ABT3J9L1_9RHOB|nr:type I-F CRISPR-associated protein Csy3 [Defluviimonas salinarum]MCW3784384.1 type I-F CRISPR-associated protein Csy3 [Defluviimonas salinarum]